VVHEPAHLIDLLPTALSVAGARLPVAELPGLDLVHQLNHGFQPRTLFFEHQGNRAVRQGRWKLVALDDEPWELYDLGRDRTEINDLAARFPERVKELSAAWEAWASVNHVTPLPRDLGVKYLKPD